MSNDKNINNLFRFLPIFYDAYSHSFDDKAYFGNGFLFIASILLLPITLPFSLIGLYFDRKDKGEEQHG